MSERIWKLKCNTAACHAHVREEKMKNPGPIPVNRRNCIRITLPPIELDLGALENNMIWTNSSSQGQDDILLPNPPPRWSYFWFGVAINAGLVAGVILISILMPEQFDAMRHYLVTKISAPQTARAKAKAFRSSLIPPRAPNAEAVLIHPASSETQRTYSPVATRPISKRFVGVKSTAPPIIEAPPPLPAPLTGATLPDLPRPREPVVVGSFGADQGSVSSPNRGQAGRSQIVNADFTLGRGAKDSRTRRGVVEGAFGAESSPTPSNKSHPQALPPSTTPVQIVYKPKPKYTAEAEAKRIEGEVDLQVLFPSSGHVEVQRILKGLGYGLDESAEIAAQAIQFRPAQADGRLIDSVAVVHIIFQLAY